MNAQTRRESPSGHFCAVEEARLLIKLRECPFVVNKVFLPQSQFSFLSFFIIFLNIHHSLFVIGELPWLLRGNPRKLYLDGETSGRRPFSGYSSSFLPFFANFFCSEKYDVFVFPQTIAKSKFHLTEAKCVVVIGQVGSFKLFHVHDQII